MKQGKTNDDSRLSGEAVYPWEHYPVARKQEHDARKINEHSNSGGFNIRPNGMELTNNTGEEIYPWEHYPVAQKQEHGARKINEHSNSCGINIRPNSMYLPQMTRAR